MSFTSIYDLRFLLTLTEKLYASRTFEAYLTNQQLIVLSNILEYNKVDGTVWEEFMSGNLQLRVSIDDNNGKEDTGDAAVEQGADEGEYARSYNDDDLSQLDLDALKDQIDGSLFVGNLSLKVRYVLSQFGIDNNLNDLLEELNHEQEQIAENGGESNQEQSEGNNLFSSSAAKEDEDDEYDFDSDEDDKPEDNGDTSEKNEEVKSGGDIERDLKTNKLIINLLISKSTLSTFLNPNDVEEKILENSNKIFHSLENDRETMLKKLKLQRSDQKITTNSDLLDDNENSNEINGNNLDEDDEDDDDDATVTVPKRHRKRDRTVDTDENDDQETDDNGHNSKKLKHLSVGLGIENLSLKHLLSSIQNNKDKLNISDYELKHLLTEVRKNRSKWTSDERIGQEELYEACERVVMELRNYTEHSTPFLNKVSKKDAPNYHLIIKKSMDLNTVLKKLKSFQYNSKQEFVDDVMLIWKNCLTYNSDPSHFLRGHAIAMQKKSLQLIPLIPNITIRNRADVERELEEMEKDKDYKDNEDEKEQEEVAGSGRKGLTMGAHKPAKDSDTTTSKNNEDEANVDEDNMKIDDMEQEKNENEDDGDDKKEDANEKLDNRESEENDGDKDSAENKDDQESAGTSKEEVGNKKPQEERSEEDSKKSDNNKNTNEISENDERETDKNKGNDKHGQEVTEEDQLESKQNSEEKTSAENNSQIKSEGQEKETNDEEKAVVGTEMGKSDDEVEEEMEDEEEEDEDEDAQTYIVEKDDDKDDVELSVWKSLTANIRAEICMKRSEYFKDGVLNSSLQAMLKNPARMKPFLELFKEYKDQKELELFRLQMEQNSIMKNGFGTALLKQEDDDMNFSNGPMAGSEIPENTESFDKGYNELDLDNSMLLKEYDIMNNLPDMSFVGHDQQEMDLLEEESVNRMLQLGMTRQSDLLATKDKGLNPKINANIQLIQEIRHICHKISLIRMLQNPYSTQFNKANPGQVLNAHQYKFEKVNDDIDIDPISQLENHDYKHDKKLMWKVMHKNVSKIAMSNGFETTQPTAINILTEIAGNYLSNLTKTLKTHLESNSVNKMKPSELLEITLLENGINKPDDLYSYIESEYEKKTKKLTDVKAKLENFLKDLLRPTLQDLSERNFEDESQSFVTGDFASNLNGEDFFGFRELGLEQEFGILSSSVPISLLSFQFQATDSETKEQVKKLQAEEVSDIIYKKVTKKDLNSEKFPKLLSTLFDESYERTRSAIPKINKSVATEGESNGEESAPQKPLEDNDELVIMEDEELPVKPKIGAKLRLPPTGKISTIYKKRPISDAFILPEEDPDYLEDNKAVEGGDDDYDDDDDYDKVEESKEDDSFVKPLTEEENKELDFQINEDAMFGSPDMDDNNFGLNLDDDDIPISSSSLNLKLG